jgi:L-iditol 2-dehydrogenase
MKNRCLYLLPDLTLELREDSVPAPEDDQVLVRIAANGICGSDIHFYKEGKLGNFKVTQPYIPGHEASGTVVAVGKQVKHLKVDDRVVIEPGIPCGKCRQCKRGRYNLCPDVVFLSAPPVNGTFCDFITVDASFVYPIPQGLSFEHAALAEPTAVAVHAVNRSRMLAGDDGVILGAGPIGLLTLQAFKAAGGGYCTVIDRMESRLALAKTLGADRCVNTLHEACEQPLGDVVFETAGSDVTTQMLFTLAHVGAHCVQVGWPAHTQVPLDVALLMEKEIDYMGLNRYANAFDTALQWLKDGRIHAGAMISHRFDLDHAAEAFAWAAEHPAETMKVIVTNDILP